MSGKLRMLIADDSAISRGIFCHQMAYLVETQNARLTPVEHKEH